MKASFLMERAGAPANHLLPPSQPLVLRHASGDVSVLASVLPHPEGKLQPASRPMWPERSAFPPGRWESLRKRGMTTILFLAVQRREQERDALLQLL